MDLKAFKIVGKVKNISKNVLTVFAVNLNRTFKIVCPFKCPIQVTDTISGFCRETKSVSLESPTQVQIESSGSLLEYIVQPFVQLSVDKDSIIACLFRAVYKKGVLTIYQFYDKCVERCSESTLNVDDYLSELSVLWNGTKDESLFRELYPCSPEICKEVCEFWYTKRVCRQLRCFGLTSAEIFEIRQNTSILIPLHQVKNVLLKNPYLLYTLPLDKIDAFVLLAGLNGVENTLNRECGKVVRELFSATNRGWIGIPLEIAYKKWKPLFPHLLTQFNCCIDNSTMYLKSNLNLEVYVARRLEQLLEQQPRTLSGSIDFTSTCLTDEQKVAIKAALTQPIMCIVGSAGTGKTICIREIVSTCDQQNLSYLIGSYTGKAVARIQEVVQRQHVGSTLHKCIHKAQDIPKFDILIVDEASMITTELFYQMLTRFSHQFSIVLIGDPNQLEPIGGGSLFEQILKSHVVPTYKLTSIKRADSESGITKNANLILDYICPSPSLGPFEFKTCETFQMSSGSVGNGSVGNCGSQTDSIPTVVELLKDLHLSRIESKDICLITPYTKDVDLLNLECQRIFSSPLTGVKDFSGIEWKLYDRVSLKANRYDIGFMNGAEGEITSLSSIWVEVSFKGSDSRHRFSTLKSQVSGSKAKNIHLDPEEDVNVELTTASLRHAFCLTIHRSQGSEWKYVILYIPPAPKVDSGSLSQVSKIVLHRKLIYTALTRAKTCIWCIGDLIHLTMAATKPSPVRCDNLAKRLSHVDEEILFL